MMGRNGPIFRLLRAEDARREDETAVHVVSDRARNLSRVRAEGSKSEFVFPSKRSKTAPSHTAIEKPVRPAKKDAKLLRERDGCAWARERDDHAEMPAPLDEESDRDCESAERGKGGRSSRLRFTS
jgi:hypothetical protein